MRARGAPALFRRSAARSMAVSAYRQFRLVVLICATSARSRIAAARMLPRFAFRGLRKVGRIRHGFDNTRKLSHHAIAGGDRDPGIENPAAGKSRPPGDRFQVLTPRLDGETLEHAEHDGADKGECEIGRDNAQSVDQRIDERHCENLPGSRRCPLTTKVAKRSGGKKTVLLLYRQTSSPGTGQKHG